LLITSKVHVKLSSY